MESLYSSLIIFSGVSITLLGALLLASERQLRNKQREFDEFKRKESVKPVKSTTASEQAQTAPSSELATKNAEVAKEIASLASQLADKQRRLDEYQNEQRRLLTVQSDNQQLRETIDSLRNQLENIETQIEESTRRIQEADDHKVTLQAEIGALKQQVAEKEVAMESLRGGAERHAQLQTDFADSKRRAEELAEKNHELLEELGRLTNKLIATEKSFEELRAMQENARLKNQQALETNEQLREEIAVLQKQLTTAHSQLDESAERNEKLQRETGELKEALEKQKASIDELREIQSESQGLRMQNQVLQQELEKQRIQVNASATRLQQADNQNQELSDRCASLKTEVADWKQRLEDSQAKLQELKAVQQQLAHVETREMIYQEQQKKLEARIVDLDRELTEANKQKASQETERVRQELEDENRRLRAEMSQWQERLVASDENEKQLSILRKQLDELRMEHERLVDEKSQAQNKIVSSESVENVSRVPSDSNESQLLQSATDNTAVLSPMPDGSNEIRADQTDHESGDSAASAHLAKDVKAGPLGRALVKGKWRFPAVPAVVIALIASAVFVGVLGTQFLTSNELAVAPEASSDEFAADENPKPQTKPAPSLRGTFETIRATQVYGGPSENAPLIANIGPGMKLNVVGSSDGWLEIRSRHGRPPGFIRQEAAVRIGQN
jgi:chromosome segregation ATPase